jgi:hypothetical protein
MLYAVITKVKSQIAAKEAALKQTESLGPIIVSTAILRQAGVLEKH